MGGLTGVYLMYQIGRRAFPWLQGTLAVGGLATGLGLNFASGYLNGAVQSLLAAVLGFTLGREQAPVKTLVVCAALVVVLNAGKGEYRKIYWSHKGASVAAADDGVVDRFSFWLRAGWECLGRDDAVGRSKSEGVLARAELLSVMERAVTTVPDRKPFLDGRTYLQFFHLIVPRIFWPGKPHGNEPTETLGIYIGVQTPREINRKSISMGPAVEGWLNFGWTGMVIAGALFGLFFGLPARMSMRLVPSQAGWLIAAIFMTYAGNLEHTLAETVCSLSNVMVPAVAALWMITRPELRGT